MEKPFFSIIIPVYNREVLIRKSIQSALNQDFIDFEIIVIDDGSTDGTALAVKQFSDSRVKYFYQTNQERSAARNNGVLKSKGKFICFLDSDDYYIAS